MKWQLKSCHLKSIIWNEMHVSKRPLRLMWICLLSMCFLGCSNVCHFQRHMRYFKCVRWKESISPYLLTYDVELAQILWSYRFLFALRHKILASFATKSAYGRTYWFSIMSKLFFIDIYGLPRYRIYYGSDMMTVCRY